MQPNHTCTTGVNANGVVVVDGREYPMASRVVATEDVIQRSIKDMAARIAKDYQGQMHRDTSTPSAVAAGKEAHISYENPLIILSILKGSYIFTADLVRYLGDCGLPHVVDFVRLASYNDGTKSTGVISVLSKPKFTEFTGKHVLIVEDVCDSGRTLRFFRDRLVQLYHPKSVKTLVLANKVSSARKVEFAPEYACIQAPNEYIIGYGFEVNDRYRDLRHVFVLKDGESDRYPAKL